MYQSINQSNFYNVNIPGKAWFSGVSTKLMFNSKINEAVPDHQCTIGCAGVYGGNVKSKRCVLKRFLKVALEAAEKDRQQDVVLKRTRTRVKCSCTCVGLDPRDRQTGYCV